MNFRLPFILGLTLIAGCRHAGDLTTDNGGGVYAVRSACPIAGVPAGTGDVTLFDPAGSTDSRAIDITAAITDVRAVCQDSGNDVVSTITFTVLGLRRDAGPARQVGFTYFDVAMRGGATIAAKQIGSVALNFQAGDIHSFTRVQATVRVNRGAATLPADVRKELTRERKSGEAEAAVDPLTQPRIRAAVANATFEHLVGFQLSEDQLRYNVTR